MARAAVRAKQQARAKTKTPRATHARRRRGSGGGNPNQQLFFMRLRRHAKWAYVLLAVLFAATFAAVGVGSGSSGLNQLFSGIFGGSSSGTSVSAAKAEIAKNPAKGWRDLARAYEGKGETANAINALRNYVDNVRSKDASAWTELGQLQLTEGGKFAARYQRARQAAQLANPGQALLPAGSLGQALATPNPLQQLGSQQASVLLSRDGQQANTSYGDALQSYETAAKLRPHNAEAQYNVAQAAQAVGQYAVEVRALKAYLKDYPNAPSHSQVKQAIKQLTAATKKK